MCVIQDPPEVMVAEFTVSLISREKERQAQIWRNLGIVGAEFVTPHIGHSNDRHLQKIVRKVARRVAVIDVNSRETWDGADSCGRALHCPSEQVRNACLRGRHNAKRGHILPICRGRNLMYLRDYNKLHDRLGSLKRTPKRSHRPVIDTDTGQTWATVAECGRVLGVSTPEIFMACARSLGYGRPALCHGHHLMFLEDWQCLKNESLPTSPAPSPPRPASR